MNLTNVSSLHSMKHETDPAKLILSAIGGEEMLSKITLAPSQVLIGTYIRPEQTSGGIILPDDVRKEDQFQGKVGLVLKTGSLAFSSDGQNNFDGFEAKVGDWVWFYPNETRALSLNKHHCRVCDDVFVRGVIEQPDMIL